MKKSYRLVGSKGYKGKAFISLPLEKKEALRYKASLESKGYSCSLVRVTILGGK